MGKLPSPIIHGLPTESLRKGLESMRQAVWNWPGPKFPDRRPE